MRRSWLALLFVTLLLTAACTPASTSPSSTSSGNDPAAGQYWLVTFNDSGSAPRPQTVRVYIAPFTIGSTWGETSGSAGLWMYAPDGVSRYQLLVGGNSFHDTNDRFDCVNLGGAGFGMQTLGRCSFTVNGHFPDATAGSGTYTLTTQSPLGTVTGTNTITARRE